MKQLLMIFILFTLSFGCLKSGKKEKGSASHPADPVMSTSFKEKEKQKLKKEIKNKNPQASFQKEDVKEMGKEMTLTEKEKKALNFVAE